MSRILIILSLLTMACSPTYRDELDQKLESKTPAEKRAILKKECGQELQDGLKVADSSRSAHYYHMQRICQEMTKE